jgi:hypothetical protein
MQNQNGKYFKYAIGEIVLVVIGILIALQINNWNQNRNNRNEEKTILTALKNEVSENQIILAQDLKKHDDVLRLIKELSDYISPEPQELDSKRLDSLMFSLGWLPGYVPKEGVINSILASGKISLIKNNELNSKLAAWSSLLNQYNTTLNWSEKDVFELILPYIKDKYPFKRTLTYYGTETKEKSKFSFSQEALLSSLEFESIVAERVIDANDVLEAANELFNFQADILELIETELKE